MASLFKEPSLYSKLYEHKRNLLYKCLEYNQPDILKFLLVNLRPQNSHPIENFNLLHIALKPKQFINKDQSDINLFKTILAFDHSADINSQDTYGNTPLHMAV